MAGGIQPLDDKFPIVGPDGRPTMYFIQWAQQKQIDITGAITAEQFNILLLQYLLDHQLVEGDGIALTPSGNISDIPEISVRNGTGLNFDGMGNIKIADTAVTPGTYGDATHVGQFTVDQQGRITAAQDVAISGGGGGGVSRLTSITTPTGTPANNTETDLLSYTLSAGLLASNGQAIRVMAAGTYFATTRNRTVKFYFGAAAFSVATATSGNVRWRLEAEIIRIDATNQRMSGTIAFGPSGTNVAAYTLNLVDATETLSGAVTVKVTGQVAGAAAANDIVGNFFLVEFLS